MRKQASTAAQWFWHRARRTDWRFSVVFVFPIIALKVTGLGWIGAR